MTYLARFQRNRMTLKLRYLAIAVLVGVGEGLPFFKICRTSFPPPLRAIMWQYNFENMRILFFTISRIEIRLI